MQLASREGFSQNSSNLTVIEISQKIKELLDQMEYSNNDMLLTKEHIKYNLSQLIQSTINQSRFELGKKDENYVFSNNFLVDNRDKIKVNFS